MRIALDVMGGDYAPRNNMEGAAQALAAYPKLEKLYLVGLEPEIKAEIERLNLRDPRLEIVPASQVIEMSDASTDAIRKKKDSSISVAVNLVKRGDAQALSSPGHTGAAVAASTLLLGRLEGVERPGISSAFPNEYGTCNLMDAGANPEAKATHLFQYAIMGAVYSEKIYGKKNPIIGLMSIGEEDEKGTALTKEVFARLKATDLNFRGNVEGTHLFQTPLDVCVCDGFIGNVILKSCEATSKVMMSWIREEVMKAGFMAKMGMMLARPAFRKVKARGSYETYGGSPLLGVRGVVIIGHGSSSATAIKNSLRVAMDLRLETSNYRLA